MGKELKRPLFYLEVGDNPEEVFVVHSSIQPDLHGQLLSSVPRTFLFGEHLLLYDSANGCVFIIKDIASFDLVTADRESSKKKKHVFKRTNVPFESYFKCGMTPPFNEKRCDIVKGNTVKETTIAPAGLSFSKVVVICLGIAFLAVALLYALKLSNKKRRSLSNRKSNPNRKLQGQSQVGFSAKSTTCLPSCTSTTVFSPNSCKISRDGNAKSSAFEIAMISKGNVTVKTLQTLKRAFSKSRQ